MKNDLTKAGTPRKRAAGGGRKPDVSGEKSTDFMLRVRLQKSREEAYKAAARGKPLSKWVTATLDRAAGYKKKD